MEADKNFPVTVGTVITLSCKEGFEFNGDNIVTCASENKFKYAANGEPQCSEYFTNFMHNHAR